MSILIIDDQIKVCHSLSLNLTDMGHTCQTATCSKEAYQICEKTSIDCALLDLALGEEFGIDVLAELKQRHPNINVIMMTGYGTLEIAVQAIKMGAQDFVQKPIQMDVLQDQLNTLNRACPTPHEQKPDLEAFATTQNDAMKRVIHHAIKLAQTDLPLLITGESGTGKELLTKMIHHQSNRKQKELVQVNCASFTESLLESELFGHEKGAFTGANKKTAGVFEVADGGTLHLDEIGDMALGTQSKILRTLQEGEVKSVGSHHNISVDCRIISSTHADLKTMIQEGRFREDLYYRLSAAEIKLPALRERPEDIPFLSTSLLKKIKPEAEFSDSAIACLQGHTWPGNIRELKNTIEVTVALSAHPVITASDFTHLEQAATSKTTLDNPLQQSEKSTIEKVYRECGFNKKKSAEALGITRATLYKKLDQYGIG